MQRPLERYGSLAPAQQRRLIRTLLLVIAIRLALWTLPFKRLRKMVADVQIAHRRTPANAAEIELIIANISRGVRSCANVIPGATCLTRALAAQVLLADDGLASTLRFGVSRGVGGAQFRAHAWLESEGKIVVGGEEMPGFAPLHQVVVR